MSNVSSLSPFAWERIPSTISGIKTFSALPLLGSDATLSSHPVRLSQLTAFASNYYTKAQTDALIGTAVQVATPAFTKTVGATGDYATLQDAFDALAGNYTAANGVRVTLEIQTGEVITTQAVVDGVDLSFVTITGVDSETTVSPISWTYMPDPITNTKFAIANYPLITVVNGGKSPVLSQSMKFSGITTDTTYGANKRHIFMLVLGHGSVGFISGGVGLTGDSLSGVSYYNGALSCHGGVLYAGSPTDASLYVQLTNLTYGAGAFVGATAYIMQPSCNSNTISLTSNAGSIVYIYNGNTILSGGTGLHSFGSTLSVFGGNYSSSTSKFYTSHVNLRSVNMGDILAYASDINVSLGVSNTGSTSVYNGSIIRNLDTIYSLGTLNVTANTLTADGIIFT